MPMVEASIPAALRERARQRPDTPAFTFVDYETDPAGFTTTLTWSQLYLRVQALAAEMESCGEPGDRVAILAPQGLDYVVGFLGAMDAGYIAVPLPVPLMGTHDERVSAALRDSSPVAILTTTGVVDDVVTSTRDAQGWPTPALVEVDALDLDARPAMHANRSAEAKVALLQYTSGSTRKPAGVVVTHSNIVANLNQVFSDYFEQFGKAAPPDTTPVSWLPFYHDMGLLLGIFAPVAAGIHAVVTTPMAFLQKPARWMQLLADNTRSLTAAPNFAFELAARRTSDEDMAGRDLGDVMGLISGSERIHTTTIRRFTERFSHFNLPDSALLPSYGLAEATLYVTSSPPGRRPETAWFDYEKLSAGHAKRCHADSGVELVSYGAPRATTLRIVDPETCVENPAGKVGEIWIHGDNVAAGYWGNPQATQSTFGGHLVEPSPGTPLAPWLRTGDLGVISEGELFIVGRIKDLVIVDGRNHYPDDIEATIQEITGGRVAAISLPGEQGERLVAIVEIKQRAHSDEDALEKLRRMKRSVTSAVSKAHGVRIADLVLVSRGSIPITTSGKVRRSACVERYGEHRFTRLDVGA
ncbi:acyl-CoA synthetase (AMP-forming)/AMP-acid ligase II [Mycobacterium sp. JS623]|uniref:AMP-binding protein n=1 Tax=Mycobacterium sp. JS623 TaxID=212767 RepID=UPI0002A5A824|nr:AMP-binding protein [Mycobacterium sp. JS623]AGB26049.1 acyl-CoA synthetase (AMP-forming)/AMP-acid ligase II [Mycobacterium sp. JS623]